MVDLTVKNVISVLEALRRDKAPLRQHEVHVISKEKAKLGYAWRAAAHFNKRSVMPHCPQCFQIVMENDEYITWEQLQKKKHVCGACGSPLWQADKKVRRFPPADYIKKYLKGYYQTILLDEIQDYKAEGSLQGRAMGSLIAASERCLCLTGTLNGGYADDLYNLLFRMDPGRLNEDGFEYGHSTKFLESFGTIERIRKTEDEDALYGRGKRKGEIIKKKPGVSPEAIGRYLLDKAVFIRLADVIEGLPPYEENVIVHPLEGAQYEQYRTLEMRLRQAVKQYKMRAASSMLQALLSYPDSCVAYPEHIEIKDRHREVLESIEAPMLRLEEGKLLAKEKHLVQLVRREKSERRKVLCYATFTGSRDIRPCLVRIFEDAKLRPVVLDPRVPPRRRETWVAEHAIDADVLICNAELVKTGLDLYNFPTVLFYQVGYNIFTLRQAARRSWRIGQHQPVRVFFDCYAGTMQEIAISLIAKKLEVALMVEGDLPEGLAEYGSSGGSLLEEMGKALIEGGDYGGAEKAWANFRKKEIENQLGLSGKETVFASVDQTRGKPDKAVSSVNENVMVKVSFISKGKRRQSVVEVKYGDLDSIAKGKMVQFALF